MTKPLIKAIIFSMCVIVIYCQQLYTSPCGVLNDRDPLTGGYNPVVWKKSLNKRVQQLAILFPRSIELMTGVKFRSQKRRAIKNLLIISQNGLTTSEKQLMLETYLEAFDSGCISFPNVHHPTHLNIRVGSDVFDLFSKDSDEEITKHPIVHKKAYRLNTRDRYEPIVALSPWEMANLREYINNALNNPLEVLGEFNLKGLKKIRTRGRLNDNRPLKHSRKHNCISWLCTAPIGKRRQFLAQIMGINKNHPDYPSIYNEPDILINWLVNRASVRRVPLVVIWTSSSIKDFKDNLDPEDSNLLYEYDGFN